MKAAAQHKEDGVKNKPASLLVASLDKTLDGMLSSLHGKQLARPSALPVVVAQSNRKPAKSVNEKLTI